MSGVYRRYPYLHSVRRPLPPLGSANNYTLTAETGSFTMAGQTTGLQAARILAAAQASFALTGQATGLLAARILTASSASFTLTGQAAVLLVARRLLVLTGQTRRLCWRRKRHLP